MTNFTKHFVVETNVSERGIGAILQENHPITYFSRTLGLHALQHSIYERDLKAVVFSILQWKHYFMGSGKERSIYPQVHL